LEYNVNEISSSEKEVEITLEFDEIKDELETEVKKQTKSIQMPGFRKGKVPKHMLKQMYGDALEHEASEKVANEHFWKVAKDNEFNPIGQPVMTDIDFKPGEILKFKVKYEIMPEIEVKDYTDQELEIPDFKVKDKEVEKEINYILRSNSIMEEAKEVGDDQKYLLNIEMLRLNDEGVPIEPGKPEKLQVDFTNEKVHKELKDKAVGKKVGDSFNFGFNEERVVKNDAGKEEKKSENFSFEVKITGVEKINFPELNEELIKKVTKDKVTTEVKLREEIKKDLQNYYDQRVEEFTRSKLINKIITNNPFSPPSVMITNILEEMINSEEERLRKQNVKKINREELRKYLNPAAENEVKWFLLKSKIQKAENIKISESDLEEMAKKDAEKTGLPVDKLLNYYKSSNQNEKFVDKKLFDFLIENNKIKMVDPEKFA
jgi:trigger factor